MADVRPADELGRVHFIGIGGAGMSGIARIMLARGIQVSGSDAKDSRALTALRVLGARVHVGHDPAYVEGVDTVVVSSAIRPSNPELGAAREHGLRVLRRAEALASVMTDRIGVAIAGTHGKTTTTSMLTVALQHCGVDPSFVIGGALSASGLNAHDGTGEHFVVEADESDGSFLVFSPQVAVVTNVEPDHLDHYGTEEAFERAFEAFVGQIEPGGALVACEDDDGSARLAAFAREAGTTVRTYGTAEAADLRLADLVERPTGSSFVAIWRGVRLGRVEVRVPGLHNAANAAGALTAGLVLGLPTGRLVDGLAAFSGTRRRFEPRGTVAGVRVFDDYAHHPTELDVTLRTARVVAGEGRVVVAFQPHRYSRTAAFRQAFGAALALADEVVVMEVYSAGEDPIPGATGESVAAAVPLPAEHVVFEPSWSAVAERLVERARDGDVVLTMGAGDVTMIGPEVLLLLEAR